MQALHLVTSWPVEHVAAAIVTPDSTETIGDVDRVYPLASLSKPIVAWAILIAVEEATLDLDAPLTVEAPAGATLRHLLAHAAGFGFDGEQAIAPVARTRIYSNTGIERAAQQLEQSAGMTFGDYLGEAVFEPLGMTSAALRGSPAFGIRASLTDTAAFVHELLRPTLLDPATAATAISPQYPNLSGIVPNVGRFDPCPWGLGMEIRGAKSPHWTGSSNSAATFGHFGGSGTMLWVDPSIDTGVVALTDRRFTEWSAEALTVWPEFSNAVVAERRRAG